MVHTDPIWEPFGKAWRARIEFDRVDEKDRRVGMELVCCPSESEVSWDIEETRAGDLWGARPRAFRAAATMEEARRQALATAVTRVAKRKGLRVSDLPGKQTHTPQEVKPCSSRSWWSRLFSSLALTPGRSS